VTDHSRLMFFRVLSDRRLWYAGQIGDKCCYIRHRIRYIHDAIKLRPARIIDHRLLEKTCDPPPQHREAAPVAQIDVQIGGAAVYKWNGTGWIIAQHLMPLEHAGDPFDVTLGTPSLTNELIGL